MLPIVPSLGDAQPSVPSEAVAGLSDLSRDQSYILFLSPLGEFLVLRTPYLSCSIQSHLTELLIQHSSCQPLWLFAF